jgi:hypothetical protein
MFGAGLFISEVYLGRYPSTLVGGIWMEAHKRKSVHSRSPLDCLTSLSSSDTLIGRQPVKPDFSSPGIPFQKQKQKRRKRSASPPWTPILSIEKGGDHGLIDTGVQRRSKSGQVFKYTITRLDRDADRRRVFIATNDDLGVEVVFSEKEMRQIVAEKQSRTEASTPPDSSSSSSEDS